MTDLPQEPGQQGAEQAPVIVAPGSGVAEEEAAPSDAILHPAKVMRIASMARQLMDELRQAPLDEASRTRMADVYELTVKELWEVLSPDLKEELTRLMKPFEEEAPSEAELRVAHAQLVGWLEGLFHGIQAMLFAQQVESRQRLEEVRRQSLPAPPQPGSEGSYL